LVVLFEFLNNIDIFISFKSIFELKLFNPNNLFPLDNFVLQYFGVDINHSMVFLYPLLHVLPLEKLIIALLGIVGETVRNQGINVHILVVEVVQHD